MATECATVFGKVRFDATHARPEKYRKGSAVPIRPIELRTYGLHRMSTSAARP